jgi:UDP-glucose:(heptosyl)LPS alpha-1,3-glucosyltransferase
MRLAFVKKRFFLHGGAEQYMKTLLGELAKEGHDIRIYANSWQGKSGFEFHKVRIIPATSFLSVYSFSKNAARALRKEKNDCIISFERTEYQDIFRAGDGCHRAWLDIRAETEPAYRRLSFRINPLHRYTLCLEKRIFAETPLIVVNSEMVKRQIVRYYGTQAEKIAVAYNGVDLAAHSPDNRPKWRAGTRSSLGIQDKNRVILFVGSGFGRKGLDTLIKALPAVVRGCGEKIVLLVVGKGDRRAYASLANEIGVGENVRFLGTDPAISRYYAASDLFVLPTQYDPFSNACLEAMASGLPVITTSNNGVAEIIDEGREGMIIPSATDYTMLSDRILSVLRDCEAMGARARAKAGQFSIDRAAARFAGLIKDLSAQRYSC